MGLVPIPTKLDLPYNRLGLKKKKAPSERVKWLPVVPGAWKNGDENGIKATETRLRAQAKKTSPEGG
jgi:hypothetical protein